MPLLLGPPNFQMEIKWLLLIHSLKKNAPIKIPRSAPEWDTRGGEKKEWDASGGKRNKCYA